ncbi:MAG: hypothetical protein JWQ04_1039, partial [Pedosphaera sp.]|nr:hypothetical protein [Pedosphaera sp.]
MKTERQSIHKKRILLADADAQTLASFREAMGQDWQVKAVPNGTVALLEMEKEPSDVVVADLDLAELDGGELLNRIQAAYPKAIRFILGRETDRERMVKQVLGAHQFLGKPLENSALKNFVEGALALENWVPRNSIRELVRRIRTLPTMPTLYLEVMALLKSPDATTEQIGAIIAKDMAMMTKLLQVLNSACFALPRKINDPAEAVGILGFETVSSMVMTIKLLSQYDKVKPVYFSIDRLWRHSTEVARSAKQIALLHTEDHALAEAAFTGGLLHDLGKVVLASNFDEQYRGAQSLARKQKLAPWEVEKEIFGASHGEIGAYLLGLWGMPLELLEVAALHHHPSNGSKKEFTPLTAVHVANALEYELNPDKEGMIVSTIDEDYLREIGVFEHLGDWREAVTKRNSSKPEAESKPIKMAAAKPIPPAVPARRPVAPVVEPEPVAQHASFFQNRWVPASLGVACFVLLAWLGIHFFAGQNERPQPGAGELATAKPPTSPTPNPPAEILPPPVTAPPVTKPAPAAAPATPPDAAAMAVNTPVPAKPIAKAPIFT